MHPPRVCARALLLAIAFAFQSAHGLNFTFSMNPKTPTECGKVEFTWSRGTPPFHLWTIPPNNPPRRTDIESRFYDVNNQRGAYTMDVTFRRDVQIMYAMGDATGDFSGGMSDLREIGVAKQGDGPCDNPGTGSPDFFFSLESPLEECKLFPITEFVGTVSGPVTIRGFLLSDKYRNQTFLDTTTISKSNGSEYVWLNDKVASEVRVVFWVQGANGENGGTSDVKIGNGSDDDGCIKLPSGQENDPSRSKSNKPNIGLIVGVVVGVLAVIAIITAVIIYRRRKRAQSKGAPLLLEEMQFGAVGDSATARLLPTGTGYEEPGPSQSYYNPTSYNPTSYNPSVYPPSSEAGSSSGSNNTPSYNIQPNVFTKSNLSSRPSASQRVIVHQDIDEVNEEPMELPPQYSESRNPIPGLPSAIGSSSAGASSSSSSSSRPVLRDQKVRPQ